MPYELQQADGIREIGTFTLRRPLCFLCGHCGYVFIKPFVSL